MIGQSESSILENSVILRTIRSDQGHCIFSLNPLCLLYMCECSFISVPFLLSFGYVASEWRHLFECHSQTSLCFSLSCFLSPSVLYAGKDTSILCSDMIFPGNRESRHTESTSSPQDRWRERNLTEKEKGETGGENKRRMGSECENVKHLRGERSTEISTLER